ncbi:MAG: hypothetical protein RR234_03690 [Christensenella sp.]
MKFDLQKAVSIANSVSNPKEAIGMGLNMLSKKNPEMAKTLAAMIKAGDNPATAIQQFAAEGKISQKDFGQIKTIYGMAKKAGFKKFDVPASVWAKAEQALSAAPGNKSGDWF